MSIVMREVMCVFCWYCTGKAIVDRVGEDNKHTVYSSRVRNVACWAVRATATQASALAENGLMQ